MENFDIEAFICAVEERPVIWDKTSELFKDRNKTKAAWEDMCNIFIDNYQELPEKEKADTGKTLLHKWNNIRDSYVKCHKKIKTLKSGDGYKKIRKYIFYDQLQFLATTVEQNTTTSSLAQGGNEKIEELQNVDANSDGDSSLIDQYSTTKSPSNPTPLSTRQEASQPLPAMKRAASKKRRRDSFETNLLNILGQPDSTPTSEDRSFFDSILPSVEKLEEDDKLQFRVEVLQLLQRFKQKQIYPTSRNTFATQSFDRNYSQRMPPTYNTMQYPQTSTPHSFASSDSTTSHFLNAEYE